MKLLASALLIIACAAYGAVAADAVNHVTGAIIAIGGVVLAIIAGSLES